MRIHKQTFYSLGNVASSAVIYFFILVFRNKLFYCIMKYSFTSPQIVKKCTNLGVLFFKNCLASKKVSEMNRKKECSIDD